MDYFLDTNIIITYLKDTPLTRKLEDELELLSGRNNLITSVVSIGEIKSIAVRNNWGTRRIERFKEVISDFIIADINIEAVVDRYAEIDAYSQGKLSSESPNFSSRNMGKNDLWIAATASYLEIEFITTDKDFDHLSGKYLKLNCIDLSKL